MTRKQYVAQLVQHLTASFLPRLAAGDTELLDEFREHRCEVTVTGDQLSIKLELLHLFNAVSASARAAGVEPPAQRDWTKELEGFRDQLMKPWPTDALEAAGVGIRLIHRSNSDARSRFEIFSIPPRKEGP